MSVFHEVDNKIFMNGTKPRLLDAEGTGITSPKMSVFSGKHSISFHKV